MNVLDIFRLVFSIKHSIGPKDILFDLVGLKQSSHLFYLIVLFLAEGQLIFEEAIDASIPFFCWIDDRLEGAFLHLILFDLFLEFLKLLLAILFVIIAHLPLIFLVISIEPQLPIQDLLILVLHLVQSIVLGHIFLEHI